MMHSRAATTRVHTRYMNDGTDITSSASISSEMRMAQRPARAGEPAAGGGGRGGGGHQNFCGTRAKYSVVMMKLAKKMRMNVVTTAWLTASPTPFGPPLAYRPL